MDAGDRSDGGWNRNTPEPPPPLLTPPPGTAENNHFIRPSPCAFFFFLISQHAYMCASMVGPHPEVLPPQPSCFQLRCAEHAGLLQNHAARGQYVCKWASAVEVCAHHLLLPPYIHITWYKVGTWKSWKEWASDRNELFQEQGRTSPCLFAFILCIRAFPDIYRLILLAKYTFTDQNKHIWWWMLFQKTHALTW